MYRRLRRDLEWSAAPRDEGALLRDPVTRREFALSPAQAEILQEVERHASYAAAARAASEALGAEIDAELVETLIGVFDDLALVESAEAPAQIRERQREARRRFHAQTQLEKLRAGVDAMRSLPYYARALADRRGPESLGDLAGLPILDKATMREQFAGLLPATLGEDVLWMSTSGTTGERQQVARSLSDWERSQSATWSLNRAVREALGSRFCRLTTPFCNGTECHLKGASRAERTQGLRLALESTVEMASLAPERAEQMARELCEHDPAYILADPAYLAIFVDHARRLRLRLPRPRLILTAYELCSELHRRRICEAFECPAFGVYGATEFGALALQCEAGRYHVNPESYIVELQPVAGAVGGLLVTSLDKKVMPLLRYQTGDLAIAGSEPCSCPWSETTTLASLEGRMADAIESADGELVTAGAVDRAVAAVTDELVTYCVVQTGRGYRLEYLPAEGFVGASIPRVVEALRGLLGVEVRAERRRELLPAASGKFRLCAPTAGGSTRTR